MHIYKQSKMWLDIGGSSKSHTHERLHELQTAWADDLSK